MKLTEEEKERFRIWTPISHDVWKKENKEHQRKHHEAVDARKNSLLTEENVPNANLFIAKFGDTENEIYIECERWVDARSFARTFYSGDDLVLKRIEMETWERFPRWQVRWFGSSLDPRNPPCLMKRFVHPHRVGTIERDEWVDIRQ